VSKGSTKSGIPAERIADYDRLISTQPGIERKGATMPYTSMNGHMFSFLSPSGSLALRLPAGEREDFIDRYGTSLHQAGGKALKEYVTIPDRLFQATEQLEPWFASSIAYIAGLKPKATRRSG
jgi:hypothetical protein